MSWTVNTNSFTYQRGVFKHTVNRTSCYSLLFNGQRVATATSRVFPTQIFADQWKLFMLCCFYPSEIATASTIDYLVDNLPSLLPSCPLSITHSIRFQCPHLGPLHAQINYIKCRQCFPVHYSLINDLCISHSVFFCEGKVAQDFSNFLDIVVKSSE